MTTTMTSPSPFASRSWKIQVSEGFVAGFYKRGCQEKTPIPSLEKKSFSDIQPLSSSLAAEVRSPLVVFHVHATTSFGAEAAQA
jgi:hypothetical protein